MNTGSVQSPSPTLPEVTISLTTEALCTLNFMATVDLSVLQVSAWNADSKLLISMGCKARTFTSFLHFLHFFSIFRHL